MKMITNCKTGNVQKSEMPVLLAYWFINNKYNAQTFDLLMSIQNRIPQNSLRIVCLNPFQSQDEIDQYKSDKQLPFELVCDLRQSGLFYSVTKYPTFILMENSGRIIKRLEGYDDDNLEILENAIVLPDTVTKDRLQSECRMVNPFLYKDNLFLEYKKI